VGLWELFRFKAPGGDSDGASQQSLLLALTKSIHHPTAVVEGGIKQKGNYSHFLGIQPYFSLRNCSAWVSKHEKHCPLD
jgi:hypothetical protein